MGSIKLADGAEFDTMEEAVEWIRSAYRCVQASYDDSFIYPGGYALCRVYGVEVPGVMMPMVPRASVQWHWRQRPATVEASPPSLDDGPEDVPDSLIVGHVGGGGRGTYYRVDRVEGEADVKPYRADLYEIGALREWRRGRFFTVIGHFSSIFLR